MRQENGTTKEFRSQLLPRYARRTRDVDAASLGSYLAGSNSRRIRTALKPLLGERHLSKSAVSRIVARLKALFTTWQTRDLSGERYAVLRGAVSRRLPPQGAAGPARHRGAGPRGPWRH